MPSICTDPPLASNERARLQAMQIAANKSLQAEENTR